MCFGKLFFCVLLVKDIMENNFFCILKSWLVYLVYSLECFGDKIIWICFFNFVELFVILDEFFMYCVVLFFFVGIYINDINYFL